MAMSIFHRITGVGLYFGTILLAAWLAAIAAGGIWYACAQAFFAHPISILLLIGYSWALLHHMLGGVRHFIWDFGYGLSRKARLWLARLTLIGSLAITVALWGAVILLAG
jgi:succinate dehydrogenase / fumarate reductase, cytochrome b subunit